MGLTRRLVVLALLASAAFFPATALGADSVYWTNGLGNKISVARLDGSGGENIGTGTATVSSPIGTALDPAAGRIYWANVGGNKISFANLDGSGGGDLTTGGAAVNVPVGIAVDPAAGRIYWANLGANTISFAKLDGSGGGGKLATGGATLNSPEGLAIDPAAGRIYWANFSADKISFAKLDGSGGGDINTGAATLHHPEGLALDPAVGRIFWSNPEDDTISFANLDGSGGGGDLATGQVVSSPTGLAIDPAAGRIYWANRNRGGSILFANVDGSGGGGVLNTGTANLEASTFPSLLLSPHPQAAPAISGAALTGSVLSCSPGTWGADLPSSLLYRAPQSFAFQWSLDGTDLPGADRSSLTAISAGDYRCRVTAQNHAGASIQTSDPRHISAPPPPPVKPPVPPVKPAAFGPDTQVTLALAAGRIPAHGPVKVRVTNGNSFAITGSLSAQTSKLLGSTHKHRVTLAARTFGIAAGGGETVKLTLPKPLQKLLSGRHKLSLKLSATVADPAGNSRAVQRTVVAKASAK